MGSFLVYQIIANANYSQFFSFVCGNATPWRLATPRNVVKFITSFCHNVSLILKQSLSFTSILLRIKHSVDIV